MTISPPVSGRLVEQLTLAQQRAILAFAPPFSKQSTHGMAREWADVCYIAGPRRSYYNTIKPLVKKGLAERTDEGFVRLTTDGLAIRAALLAPTPPEETP